MSYGHSEPDLLRRAATSVHRILKGKKAGEALLTIPPSLL
jgi:hypothetical protein